LHYRTSTGSAYFRKPSLVTRATGLPHRSGRVARYGLSKTSVGRVIRCIRVRDRCHDTRSDAVVANIRSAASRGVLTTLDVRPEIGRWFSTAEDTPGGPAAVLLTNSYWHRTFGGDGSVLDRALTVNGRPHQITGVMPADFRFGGEFEIVLPLRIDQGAPLPLFRLLGVPG
jgi:hypothetical protein